MNFQERPILRVHIMKCYPDAKVPTAATPGSAGYDLYAYFPKELKSDGVIIDPGKVQLIGTGLKIKAPYGYFGALFPRSGLSLKQGLRLANCVGICDEDYTGEYKIALYNDSNIPRVVKKGDRIAQLVFLPWHPVQFKDKPELEETERGDGGFGSTG